MGEKLTYGLRARRHLARRDDILKRLIAAIGPCTLAPDPNGFGLLVRSIIAQQISAKAASAIHARLERVLSPHGVTPTGILQSKDEQLQSAGLSANKMRSLRDLADKVHGGAVPLDRLESFSDEEVIAALLPVRGIGRWTAQMFLIFALGRPDVLPLDDLGLRTGAKRAYELADLPDRKQLLALAEPWQPFRTVATWYLWRSLGSVPQSDPQE
jgi:DNA-3-methyladenine glycosylase II